MAELENLESLGKNDKEILVKEVSPSWLQPRKPPLQVIEPPDVLAEPTPVSIEDLGKNDTPLGVESPGVSWTAPVPEVKKELPETKFYYVNSDSILGIETGQVTVAKEGDNPDNIVEHVSFEDWDKQDPDFSFSESVSGLYDFFKDGYDRVAGQDHFVKTSFNWFEGMAQLPEYLVQLGNNIGQGIADEVFLDEEDERIREWKSSVRNAFKRKRRMNKDEGGRGESILGDVWETMGGDKEDLNALYDEKQAGILGLADPTLILTLGAIAGPKAVGLANKITTAVGRKAGTTPIVANQLNALKRLGINLTRSSETAAKSAETTAKSVPELLVEGKINPAAATAEELEAATKLSEEAARGLVPEEQLAQIAEAAKASKEPSKFAKALREKVLQPISNVTAAPIKKITAAAGNTARILTNPVKSAQEVGGLVVEKVAGKTKNVATRTEQLLKDNELLKIGLPISLGAGTFISSDEKDFNALRNAFLVGATSAVPSVRGITLSSVRNIAQKLEKTGAVVRRAAQVKKTGGGARAAQFVAARTPQTEVQQALLKAAGIEISEDMAELAGSNILSYFGRAVTGLSSASDGLLRSAAVGGAIGYGADPTQEGFLNGIAPGVLFGAFGWGMETAFSKMLNLNPDNHSAYIRSVFKGKSSEEQALLKQVYNGDPGGLALALEIENIAKGLGLSDSATGIVSHDVGWNYVKREDFIRRYNEATGLVLDRAENGVFIEKDLSGKPTVIINAEAMREAGPHEAQHVINALIYNLDKDKENVNLQAARDNVRQAIGGIISRDETGRIVNDGSGRYTMEELTDKLDQYLSHFKIEVKPGEPIFFKKEEVIDAEGRLTQAGHDLIVEELHADAGMIFTENAADLGVLRYAKWVTSKSDRTLNLVMAAKKGTKITSTRSLGESALFWNADNGVRNINSPDVERAIAQQYLEKAGITDRLGLGDNEVVPKQSLSSDEVRGEAQQARDLLNGAVKNKDLRGIQAGAEEVKKQVESGLFKTRTMQPKDRMKLAKEMAKVVYNTDKPSETQIASQLYLIPKEEFSNTLGGRLAPKSRPIMLSPREIQKRDERVFTELKATLNNILPENAAGGLSKIESADGGEHWHGPKFSEAQLEAIENATNIPDHVKNLAREFNGNAISGDPVQGWYYKVNKRRGNVLREKKNFSIISLNISKAQNLYANVFDRTRWTRKAERMFKTGRDPIAKLYSKPGDRSWLDGYKDFEADTLQLLRNHEDGLHGATNLDPDITMAEKKRDAIIGFLRIPDLARGKGPNPYFISDGKKGEGYIRSFRLDRMFDPKRGMGDPGRPMIEQQKLKERYMPDLRGTNELTQPLPESFSAAKVTNALLRLNSSRSLDSNKAFLTPSGEFLETVNFSEPLPYRQEFNELQPRFSYLEPVYNAGFATVERDNGTIFVNKTRPLSNEQELALRKEANAQQKEVIVDKGGMVGEQRFMPSTIEQGFTSRAEALIKNSPAQAMTIEQLQALLSGKNGVKQDEIKWRGLTEIFERPKEDMITLDEVQEVLDANPLRMDKYVFAELNSPDISDNFTLIKASTGSPSTHQVYNRETGQLAFTGTYEEAVTFAGGTPGKVKFDGAPLYNSAELKVAGGENYREIVYSFPQENDRYRPGHFQSVPNYLAHTRLTDRFTPTGEKVLFIEELQSDRHQDGRKKGYKSNEDTVTLETITKSRDDAGKALFNQAGLNQASADQVVRAFNFEKDQVGSTLNALIRDFGGRVDSIEPGLIKRYVDLHNETTKARIDFRDKIPDAPFRTSWVEFMMRDLIQQGIDGGYDSIAWTNGLTQSQRNRQGARAVKDVTYRKLDLTELNALEKELGKERFTTEKEFRKDPAYQLDYASEEGLSQTFRESDIGLVFGDEIKNKIRNEEGETVGATGAATSKVLTFEKPLDLPSKAMAKFYDAMVPDKVNKYLRAEKGLNVNGIQVEPTRLLAGGEAKQPRDLAVIQEAPDRGAWIVVDRDTDTVVARTFPTEAEALSRLDEMLKEDAETPDPSQQDFVTHGFRLNEDIVDKVKNDGQYFFMPDVPASPPNWANFQSKTTLTNADKVFRSIYFKHGIDPTDTTLNNRFNGLAYYNPDTGLLYIRDIEDIPGEFKAAFAKITRDSEEANPNDFQTNEELNRYPKEEQQEIQFQPEISALQQLKRVDPAILGVNLGETISAVPALHGIGQQDAGKEQELDIEVLRKVIGVK